MSEASTDNSQSSDNSQQSQQQSQQQSADNQQQQQAQARSVTLDDSQQQQQASPPPATQQGKAVVYEPTGDAGMDRALAFVGQQGFGPDSPEIQAAAKGDFSLLRASLAAKGDKAQGWQEHIALAEGAMTKAKEADAATRKAVVELQTKMCQAAGTEWEAVREWAKTNASPEEKTAINGAFSTGGVAAKMAMAYMLSHYSSSAEATVEPRSATSKTAGTGNASPTHGPMTAKEYSNAVQGLSRSMGGRDPSNSPQYAELQRRREAGRRAGK